jgi:8-oxo-dGTP diphosphatase
MQPHQPKVGVGLIVLKEGQILMGYRQGAHGAGTWGVVGGHMEWQEQFVETAMRETLEESGIYVTTPVPVAVTNDYFTEDERHYVTIHLVARHLSGEPTILEPDFCEKWEWRALDNLPEPLFLPLQNLKKSGFDFAQLEKLAARAA